MPATYDSIASVTVGTAQNNIDFTSISGSYTDLILVINGFSTLGSGIYCQVGNGSVDTAANYSFTYLFGNGSAASSGRSSSQNSIYCGDQPSSQGQITTLQFQNYSNTTTNKTILSRGSSASQSAVAVVGLWRSTSAINIIRVSGNNFGVGTTLTLYGIKAA